MNILRSHDYQLSLYDLIGRIGRELAFDELIGREEPEVQGQAFQGIYRVEPGVGHAGFSQLGVQKGPVLRSGQCLDGQQRLEEGIGQGFWRAQDLDPCVGVRPGPGELIRTGKPRFWESALKQIEKSGEVLWGDGVEDVGVSEEGQFHGFRQWSVISNQSRGW